MTSIEDVIALARCKDVHAVRWDVPAVMVNVMTPCHACVGWGEHVAQAVRGNGDTEGGLRVAVRHVVKEALRRRAEWSRSDKEGAVARAVAYQSIAGLLIRALDEEAAR